MMCPCCNTGKMQTIKELEPLEEIGSDRENVESFKNLTYRGFRYRGPNVEINFNSQIQVCCTCGYMMEFMPISVMRRIVEIEEEKGQKEVNVFE